MNTGGLRRASSGGWSSPARSPERRRDRRVGLTEVAGVGRQLAPTPRSSSDGPEARRIADVGDDLEGVTVAADLGTVELGLHAAWLTVFGAAAEDNGGGPRPTDQGFAPDDVADDVDEAGARLSGEPATGPFR